MFTLGADVEVFARDSSGKAIALCGMIGGTKQRPKQISGMSRGFMVQEDNVSIEYNIPPAYNIDEFVSHISSMGQRVSDILNKLKLSPVNEASISFDEDQLQHPQAKVFGCEPDYNAWTKTENSRPHCENKNLRTAGGHVHVGTTSVDMITGIRFMDLYLGVPSILIDDSVASATRRELYGKAGAMRPKPYGFEYRTLSNFWMFSKELTTWVYQNAQLAMNRSDVQKITIIEAQQIQECINTGNTKLAQELIAKYGVPLPKKV